MDKNIKQFPDPSIDILCLKPLSKAQKLTTDSQIIDFMEKNPLPTISLRTLESLKSLNNKNSDVQTKNKFIEEVLYDFPYQENIINFFLERVPNTNLESEIFLYYILYSFVSWKLTILSTKDIESTLFILNSLLYISSFSESPLPISAFLYTITSFLTFSNLSEFSKFLPPIRSLFIQNKNLPDSAFALFPHCIYLLISGKEDCDQYLREVYEILKQVVSKSDNEFPQQIADETLVALSPSISRLEQTPMFIFSLLTRFATPITISQFIITIAIIIIDTSIKSDIKISIPKPDESKVVKEYKIPENTPGITMHFIQQETFLNGFKVGDFLAQEGIQSLIPDDLILDLKTIVMIMYDNDDYSYQYGISLINYLNQNMNNPKIINSFPIVIFSFLLLRMKGNKIPSIIEIFKNKIIFNPEIICDNSMKDLNSLRGGALELYLYEGAEALYSLLNWSLPHPSLFGELIKRLMSNIKMCLPLFSKSTNLIRLISNSLLFYQKIRLKDDEEYIDEVRASILLFLSNCFEDKDCADFFFSDSIFIRVFLSLTFETPLRNFVFSQLKKLFVDILAKQKPKSQISEELNLIFESIELNFPEFKPLELANQFLEILCDLLNYQRLEFKKEFSIITPVLFKGFSRLDSSSECEKYMLNSLQFLTDTSNFYEFKKCHFEILLDGIQRAFDLNNQTELHHQLFSKISHLMAGERLSTSTTSFIVRQPFGIWLLLSTFLDTSTFSSALKFVIEICQYHSANCHQCRKGDVDLFLISVIKNPKYFESIDICFQLLILIASNFSAPCVVENYVSMFQFEGNEVPPYFQKAMKYFASMLTADLKVPKTILKLVKSSVIEPTSFEFSVSNGFTLAFWVYLERASPQYYPSIVSLQDQNGHFFHLFWASDSLRFSHFEDPLTKSEKIESEVQLRQWSFVTITYKVHPPYYYVLPAVNGPSDEEIIEKKAKRALNGPLKIQVGGTLINSIDSDSPCILGPFALYPILKENHIQDLFSKGIRALDQIEISPIFIYNENNRFQNQTPNFASVLTAQVGLTILFPLFSVIDSLLDSAFEAFSSSLMTDPNVELEFAKTDCFSIIPYLLQETDKSQATYHLYLKFFQLMQNLQTEELKHQMFGSIMTNFDLWIHSTLDNFLLIVKHWLRTLFPSFASQVSLTTPFSSILNQMMIYFHEDDILNVKLNLKSPAAATCKFHLSLLLQFIATISFNFSDFVLLISYINHLYPNQLALDATQILREIAHSEPSPLFQFASEPSFLSCLHSLLKIPKVCVCGIDIILLMFSQKIINQISLREEVIFCIQLLDEHVIDNELFAFVAQQTVSIPELFPLSCYVSKFLGNQNTAKMIELFQPSPNYITNEDTFYPIVTAHFLGKEARYSILSFLAQCDIDSNKWKNINNTIKIVEKCFNDSTRELESIYLFALIDILMKLDFSESKNVALMKTFTQMAKRFIFFREPDEERSIFVSEETNDKRNNENNDKFSFDDIAQKFESLEYVQSDTTFGLRFGNDNDWVDSNLSMRIVELFEKKKIQTAINFDLMLAFYLINDNAEFVKNHFNTFEIPKQNKEFYEPYVALLDRKLQRFSIESTISSSYKNLKYDDNVFDKFIRKNSEKIRLNSKVFNSEIQQFYVNCRKHFETNCFIDSNQLTICANSKNEMIHTIVSKSLINEKLWRRIRRCLTLPFAPWYRKSDSDVIICKNSRLCGFGFPALSKIKSQRNLTFSKKVNEINTEDYNINDSFNNDKLITEDQELLLKGPCKLINPNETVKAFIMIYSKSIIIRLNPYKTKQHFLSDITEVNMFILQNQDTGIEIFLKDGKSILVDFLTKNLKENAMNILHKHVLLNNIDLFKLWRNREITTFEFLIRLNRKLSRSFNYPLRAPIFPPFLIDDDLNSPSENEDEIMSSDLSEILYSSLHQSSEILNNYDKDNLKVSFDLNFSNTEAFTDESEDEDEVSIDIDDLDNRHLINKPIPSASLGKNPKKLPKENNEIDQIKSIKDIKIESNNYLSQSKNQLHLPGSVGYSTTMKYSSFISKNIQEPNLISEIKPLNATKMNMQGANKVSEFDSSSETSIKLHEICLILSEGGTCSIDYYTLKDNFYKRRKILESDDVSANINLWLSRVFQLPQISMRIPRIHKSNKSHFIKTNLGTILHSFISIVSNISLTSSFIEHDESSAISVDLISNSGFLTLLTINKKPESDYFDFESSPMKISGFDDEWQSAKFKSLSPEFAIFKKKNNADLHCFDKENNLVFPLNYGPTSISVFATSNSYLLTCPETSSVNVYCVSDLQNPINTHRFFQSPPLCAAISESFHTIVIGSDGRLIVAPLESGSSMMAIDIDGYKPLKIVITENFGFVVTHSMKVVNGQICSVLFLHNIDGELIRMKKISFELDILTHWSDMDGIDYLAVSDKNGKIMTGEAYYLSFPLVLKRCLSRIISMKYSKEWKSLVVVTVNGNIFIEPIALNNNV